MNKYISLEGVPTTYKIFLCYDCAALMRHAFGAEKISRGDESGVCEKCKKRRIGGRYEVKR